MSEAGEKFSDLVGKTLTRVELSDEKDMVTLWADDGRIFRMSHSQDCCETVTVESVVGDLADLIGVPILLAEEAESRDNRPDKPYVESFTWTFYKLATMKGYVDIRWLGESNGYYSENVDFYEVSAFPRPW